MGFFKKATTSYPARRNRINQQQQHHPATVNPPAPSNYGAHDPRPMPSSVYQSNGIPVAPPAAATTATAAAFLSNNAPVQATVFVPGQQGAGATPVIVPPAPVMATAYNPGNASTQVHAATPVQATVYNPSAAPSAPPAMNPMYENQSASFNNGNATYNSDESTYWECSVCAFPNLRTEPNCKGCGGAIPPGMLYSAASAASTHRPPHGTSYSSKMNGMNQAMNNLSMGGAGAGGASSGGSPGTGHSSWVRGNCTLAPDADDGDASYPTPLCRFFDRHGFVFLPGFAAADEVASMKAQMRDLVEREWNPSSQPAEVFRTDSKQVEAQGRSDYFLDSASRCHFFAEKDAAEESGELKEEYQSNKLAALNKAGHGMHTQPGAFKDYTQSNKVANLLRELGWVDPTVPQSMYIFKQAKIGGEVTSHQDSTFLYTTPRQTCIGLWLALDDATLQNGCLWVRPGSHKESVRRQFVRNPDHFGASLDYTGEGGDVTQPQMIFRQLTDGNNVTWEGALPEGSLPMPECKGLYEAGFVPVPCKAGDLLAFCGELDHLSLPNYSSKARHTFQLHCIEGEKAGVTWSKENWLQYPSGAPFMKL